MEWDESQHFPVPLFKEMGALGFMGVLVPEEYGGAGLGYQEYITIIDEIAQVCGSIGLSVAAHNSLCTGHILQFGTDELRRRNGYRSWLRLNGSVPGVLLRQERVLMQEVWIPLLFWTETHYVLNGSKNWITHAISSEIAVVIARTGEKGDSHGMTAFVVEKSMPGFTAGQKENKLGMRASETACLFFDDCRVPKENILGKVGEGFIQSMKILDGGRISIAALSVGIARGAMDAAIAMQMKGYSLVRKFARFKE